MLNVAMSLSCTYLNLTEQLQTLATERNNLCETVYVILILTYA